VSGAVDAAVLADLRARIERGTADPGAVDPAAVRAVVDLLDRGAVRVAEKVGGTWVLHEWVREAILQFFRVSELKVMEVPPFTWYDRIPLKTDLKAQGVRVVPPGTVRYGAFLEPGCVVMPGYVNIGAYVGAGTMVDTWATVGSCAQIGRNVHLSGGVGIGGVLEPPGARPVIVEDGAFVGSRSIVVEGVIVEEEAVLAAGTVLTASTPIVDVTGPEPVVTKGRIPARSVVMPGTRPKVFPAGTWEVPCALVVGRRSASTDRKTSLNQALREFDVPA